MIGGLPLDSILRLLCIDPGERQSKENTEKTTCWPCREIKESAPSGSSRPGGGGGSGSTLKGVLTGFAEAQDRRLKGDRKEDMEALEYWS